MKIQCLIKDLVTSKCPEMRQRLLLKKQQAAKEILACTHHPTLESPKHLQWTRYRSGSLGFEGV